MNNLNLIIQNGQAVTNSRQVAENFGKEHKHVMESIRSLHSQISTAEFSTLFSESEYKASNGKTNPEYLMNRDGFTLLAMGFTGQKATEWKIKYIQAFNEMEKQQLPQMSQLEILAQIARSAADQEKKMLQIEQTQIQQSETLQNMRDVVALSSTSWRSDSSMLISKMARKLGGTEHIQELRNESYKLLNDRMGVDLKCRLTNKRRRMADEGICKSKRDNLNHLDVISEDKKLIEGYIAIVKEIAIKYGI
jgi:Rha family phage regulatory protein